MYLSLIQVETIQVKNPISKLFHPARKEIERLFYGKVQDIKITLNNVNFIVWQLETMLKLIS